jgi:hypothetical protein
MEAPPLFSTFTLFTEMLVTVFIVFIFYKGYRYNVFHTKIALFTLLYEILFNISYMSYRALTHEANVGAHHHTPFHIGVAVFHGIFSISMFLLLIIFLLTAWKKYKSGKNFFFEHKILTFTFLVLWFIAISSGLLFYYLAYFTNT